MKKIKLNLAKAIQLFKKDANKRNIRAFESEVADYIDEQISIREDEIKKAEKDLGKITEQNERDYKDSLLSVNEEKITTVRNRQDEAEGYVKNALAYAKRNEDYKEQEKKTIQQYKDDISALEKLREILQIITVEVEEEPE